jgi:hypothetical protein
MSQVPPLSELWAKQSVWQLPVPPTMVVVGQVDAMQVQYAVQ